MKISGWSRGFPLAAVFLFGQVSPAGGAGKMDPLIQKGWKLIESKKADEAVRLFKKEISLNPGNALIHRAYQIAGGNLGRGLEIEEEYREHARSNRNDGLGIYLYFISSNDEKLAQWEVERASESSAGDPWMGFSRSILASIEHVNHGREEAALKVLERAAPGGLAYDLHSARAWPLIEQGKYSLAERELKDALDEIPFDPAIYEGLVRVYCDLAQFEKCLLSAEWGLALRETASLRYARSYALKMTGQAGESSIELNRVIEIPPRTPGDFVAIGWARFSRGETKKAWESFYEAKRRSIGLWSHSAILWVEKQAFGNKQAREDCNEILKINPHGVDALAMSGLIHLDQGCECEEAVAAFDKILEVNPRNIPAWLGKSAAKISLERPEEALRDAETALGLAPKAWDSLSAVAGAHQALGNYAEAARYFRRSLSINPDNAQGHLGLAMNYLLLERPVEAEASLLAARAHRGTLEDGQVQEMVSGVRTAVIAERFKRFARRGRLEPVLPNLGGAPSAVRAFLQGASGRGADGTEPPGPQPAKLIGQSDAPWLTRIIVSEDKSIEDQVRYRAVTRLGELGRWDELLTALRAPGSKGADLALMGFSGGAFSKAKDSGHYVSEIEKTARVSPNPHSRAGALRILEGRGDPKHAEACIANLSYSEWGAQLTGDFHGAEFQSALARFQAACSHEEDWIVRMAAAQCLGKLEVPASITPLLAVASHSAKSFERTQALAALSSVGKENFGALSTDGNSEAVCKTHLERVWELAVSTAAEGRGSLDELKAIVNIVENTISLESSRRKDARVLKAWEDWWNARRENPPPRFVDRELKLVEMPSESLRVALYSSGRVVLNGPGFGEQSFGGLLSLAGHVEMVKKHGNLGLGAEGRGKAYDWIQKEAIPALQKFQAAGGL